MLNRLLQPLGLIDPARAQIDQLAREFERYTLKLKDTPTGRLILAADAEAQKASLLAMLAWHTRSAPGRSLLAPEWHQRWCMLGAIFDLLRRRLPFAPAEVAAVLEWALRLGQPHWRGLGQLVRVLADYQAHHPLTDEMRTLTLALADQWQTAGRSPAAQQQAIRLRELAGAGGESVPVASGEPWAAAARADLAGLPEPARGAWARLLRLGAQASGSTPSARWLKQARALRDEIGGDACQAAQLRWFALVAQPRPDGPEARRWELDSVNVGCLRGLAWLGADRPDADLARGLAALAGVCFRKLPGLGPRAPRLGNACLWALGQMPGPAGLAQLAILNARLKTSAARKVIAAALAAAGERAGLSPRELAERLVPDFGLTAVGERRVPLGDCLAEVVVAGTTEVELRWRRPDGRRSTAVPAPVKTAHAAELKELKQSLADLRRMLPAQRDRLESLYLAGQKWPYAAWREHYLDHPLVGTLARRLIWKFSRGDQAASGIWRAGRIEGRAGPALDWLDAHTQVELWHPLNADSAVVLEWRAWLTDQAVRQPFKQAHREVYLLTDAERATATYSNRFAAHLLRQHQFNALCAARGWQNQLRLLVDDDYQPALRLLPEWGLRAEFWIEGVGQAYGEDTTAAGAYRHVVTDQVRFYALDACRNWAHAGGGGYAGDRRQEPAEPLPLAQIPPLVFSEVMRDVDLFVGVASVGNDPAWADGGPQGRPVDYWARYAFGTLAPTAETRRQVLADVLPRLKIAPRCRLADRFLVVRGDRRTYKIHLGSGNILMEPNDQYLCIVPARGPAALAAGPVFLPFEGDQTLAVILSKAFLLAADAKITDPTILRQISSVAV
ncbi:MAG: DUF4132 domain-containing protein [Anaerolineales bacterium]|nr:DUF4132 domain-containing protein [Anaerolineales bacterium]